ncbi:hypothetical protein GCM10025858_32120 [Alicyclobacillus sacchari]|nr:hypothetical protein GCM10025858_32120 [Alicyclobacillus sacchari]
MHDIMVALGLGADAVVPYLMWELAVSKGDLQAVENLYKALTKGVEKVISTLGIHEVRGYERLFGAIGLSEQVSQYLAIPNFCGSDNAGLTFGRMEALSELRQSWYGAADRKSIRPNKLFQLYPRIWKSAGSVADGSVPYDDFVAKLAQFEADNPLSIRHLLGFRDDLARSTARSTRRSMVTHIPLLSARCRLDRKMKRPTARTRKRPTG